jgi:hypothetical protein
MKGTAIDSQKMNTGTTEIVSDQRQAAANARRERIKQSEIL